ncbi:bile acid:sodium symporter family protein [Sulfurivermis fontis]|uniref:bile acid:sodium symporter family protein n=1 Tax=Sulfurivermis fontis TaxID=1972068 RepID=UPI000FDC7FDC|nr:bile acid:sodium symporter family protein [Sulfurivermis fontis]
MLALLRLIANGLAPLTLAGAVAAYLEPGLFLVFKDVFLWLFAATMFALGVVLDPADMQATLGRPRALFAGLAAQYTLMPLLGFAAAAFGGLPPALALGFVIVGCAPGAMASNVIVYLAGGAVAYSIALTILSTLLSPLLTPLLVQWLGSAFLDIPFWPMMQTILMTVVAPLIAGMGLRQVLGKRLTLAQEIAPAVAAVAIVIICSYAVAANQARLAEVGGQVFLLVVLLNALGYVLGWQAARWFGFDLRHRLTLAIEIGMQNAGLGVALALKHFAPETALPGALFAVWCIITSAGAASYFRRTRHRTAVLTP